MRYNKFSIPLVAIIFTVIGLLHFLNITLFGLYTPILLFNYAIMFTLGFTFYRFKYDFFEALSIAYCILFVNIFYWELPIYVYTFLMTGQFAWYMQLSPLALFPATHVYKHIHMIERKKAIFLFASGLVISTLFLIPIHVNGWVIWLSETVTQSFPSDLVNILWFSNRTICYLILTKIFYN